MKKLLIRLFRRLYLWPLGGVICLILLAPVNVYGRDKSERANVSVKRVERKRIKNKSSAKTPKSTQSLALQRNLETKLIKGISQTIKFLKQTAARMKRGSPGRLDMLTKILNLRLEQATYEAFEEQASYDERWNRWEAGGRRGREPKISYARSRQRWQQVVTESKKILAEFPKSKSADFINFNQALAYQFLSDFKGATNAFRRMIKRYPKSPLVGDAHFFIGDYLFERNQFKQALRSYKKVGSYKKSQRYGWSMYKMGWSYFNLGDFHGAIREWKRTINYSRRVGGKQGQRLQEEALRDLIFAFAELGQVSTGIDYLRQQRGEEHIPRFLKLMASTLTEQGKFTQAVQVWKRLLAAAPQARDAIDAQREIIALYFDGEKLPQVWRELVILARDFGIHSNWAQSFPEIAKQADKRNEELMLYYAKIVHQKAQKSNRKKTFAQAKQGYREYLKAYPQSAHTAEVFEFIADINYFDNNYAAAGRIYLYLAKLGKKKAVIVDKNGRITKNIHQRSAQNMLDAYNRNMLGEFKALMRTKPNFEAPRPLSKNMIEFAEACSLYAKWYPRDGKTLKTCETYATEIFYRNGHKEKAKLWLNTIIKKYPQSKEARLAAENLVPLYADNKPEQIKLVARLLAMRSMNSGALGKKLRDLNRELQVGEIAKIAEPLKRAQLYEAQARASGSNKSADILWNNAATNYLEVGDISHALYAYGVIIAKFPKSKVHHIALIQSAKIHDKLLNFEVSAKNYLTYAARYPKQADVAGARQRACTLLTVSGARTADAVCIEFAKRYPEAGKGAIEGLIKAAWRSRQGDRLVKLVKRHYLPVFRLNNNEKIIALYKQYQLFAGKGRSGKAASRSIVQLSSSGNVNGQALRYAGEILYNRAKMSIARVHGFRLSGGNVANLQKSIQAFTQGLAKSEKSFAPLFALQDSFWAVAAFQQLGSGYEHFARSMQNPPAVKGAKLADVKQQLQGSVTQVLAKAKDFYSAGLETAKKFSVHHPARIQIDNGLARLTGKKISFEEWIVTPDFLGSEVVSTHLSDLRVGQ